MLLSNKNCFVLLQTGAEVKTDTCLRWSTLLIFFIISKILIPSFIIIRLFLSIIIYISFDFPCLRSTLGKRLYCVGSIFFIID